MQAARSRTLALLVSLSLLQAPVCALSANTVEAIQALVAFRDGCQRAEALWPAKLCGPIVLVDPSTREAVANQPDPTKQFKRQDEMFVGEWPANMDVANTAMAWGGTQWAVVMLPLSQDPFTRLQLLAHESFHRIQPELGFEMADAMAQHLDEQEGRTWLRLELRALARSLRSEGDEARNAALDALLFRRVRRRLRSSPHAPEGAEPDPMKKWFSESGDVRNDDSILESIKGFLRAHAVKSVVAVDRIIGCPHEEGIDYPEGGKCPECPFWANRDRFTSEILQ